MQENTPPHDDQYEDFDIGEIEEVVDDENDDDQAFLDEGISENEEDEMEDDVGEDIDEEGDEIKASPVIYSFHQGSVFCCALSPKGNIGASGGEDDKAFIWDTATGSTIFECSGHKDSVIDVAFSHTGEYLATGDMKGYIQVWKISTESRIWEFETDDLTWLLWHHSSNVLFAGTSGGEVWMWLIPKGTTKMLCHTGMSAECGSLTRDGKRLCVGFVDGFVSVIDLKSGQTLHNVNCHKTEVTTLSTHSDNTLLMSGSPDGSAKIVNSTTGKIIASLPCGISADEVLDGEHSASDCLWDKRECVEVVSFCPSMANLAVSATLSGVITVWDVSAQVSRHHIVQGCGTSKIIWHPRNPHFLTGGLDGILRVYDARSAELLFRLKGHQLSILSCDISKDGNKVITSSDDGTVRILNTEVLFNS